MLLKLLKTQPKLPNKTTKHTKNSWDSLVSTVNCWDSTKNFVNLNTKIKIFSIKKINCNQYWYVATSEWCNIPMVSSPCSLLLPTTLMIAKISFLLLVLETLNYHRCSWDQMFNDVGYLKASYRQHELLSTQKITSTLTVLRLNLNSLCLAFNFRQLNNGWIRNDPTNYI